MPDEVDKSCAYSLSHGNADVERSSSVNMQATGTNTTLLTPESLNGVRQVKNAVTAEDPPIGLPQEAYFVH